MIFFLFAAGLGSRLRPLTLKTPKPLLNVHEQTLLGRLLEQILPCADSVIINTFWLAEQIEDFVQCHYSDANIIVLREKELLDTGGAIVNALEHERQNRLGVNLSSAPFAVVNSDIYTDYNFSALTQFELEENTLAHLVLVNCPASRERGDFNLLGNRVSGSANSRGELVYSGISVVHPDLLSLYQRQSVSTSVEHRTDANVFSLSKALYYASSQACLSGEHFKGVWCDVGTQQSLVRIREQDRVHCRP